MKGLLTILLISSYLFYGCKENKIINKKANEFNLLATKLRIKSIEYYGDSALVLYDKAISADKSWHIPHTNKATIYVFKKNFKKALIEMELCLLKKPDLAEAWFYAGMLYEKFNEPIKAKKYYIKSVEIYNTQIKLNEYSNEFFRDGDIVFRATSLKFLNDTNYLNDILELRKKPEHSQNDFLFDIESKSKIELMKDMGL